MIGSLVCTFIHLAISRDNERRELLQFIFLIVNVKKFHKVKPSLFIEYSVNTFIREREGRIILSSISDEGGHAIESLRKIFK
jgi:uncharacterized protein YabN with tetrapyrrole methylase and pyrophosphatase domain